MVSTVVSSDFASCVNKKKCTNNTKYDCTAEWTPPDGNVSKKITTAEFSSGEKEIQVTGESRKLSLQLSQIWSLDFVSSFYFRMETEVLNEEYTVEFLNHCFHVVKFGFYYSLT